jgi:hypothetical protein
MPRISCSIVVLLLLGACAQPRPGSGLQVRTQLAAPLKVDCVRAAFQPLFAKGIEPLAESSQHWTWTLSRYEKQRLSWKTAPVARVDVGFVVEWRNFGDKSDGLSVWYQYNEEAWKKLSRMQKLEFEGQWELRRTVLFEMINTLAISCGASHDMNDVRPVCEGEICEGSH